MNAAKKKTRRPAAAFVITLALGCKRESTEGPDARSGGATATQGTTKEPPATARVTADTDGSCLYHLPAPGCPKGAPCNPPEPERIECPPELRKAGAPPVDPARPTGKKGWFRIPAALVATPFSGCYFRGEGYCGPVELARCEPGETIKLTCTATNPAAVGDAKRFAVSPFTYRDPYGVCHAVPATECSVMGCALPASPVVACP
jgi:hypothetical protein